MFSQAKRFQSAVEYVSSSAHANSVAMTARIMSSTPAALAASFVVTRPRVSTTESDSEFNTSFATAGASSMVISIFRLSVTVSPFFKDRLLVVDETEMRTLPLVQWVVWAYALDVGTMPPYAAGVCRRLCIARLSTCPPACNQTALPIPSCASVSECLQTDQSGVRLRLLYGGAVGSSAQSHSQFRG